MSYIFTSNRLGFRHWIDSDKEPFFNMNSDEDVMRYFPKKLTKPESDGFVKRITTHFDIHGFGLYAVDLLESNEFIGFIGFQEANFDAHFTPCIEIGWRLRKEYWNNGLATEGAQRCLDYAKQELKFEQIYSFTASTNIASESVMKKIGLVKAGEFNHPKIPTGHPLCRHVLYIKQL